MTPMERFNAAKIALVAMLAWLIGWPLVLIIIAMATAKADQYCFEQDSTIPAPPNLQQWIHNSVVLWGSVPKISKNGTRLISLRGYGYNDAPIPNGGTDLVPLVGAAVQDVDGAWIVSLTGTLLQYSTIGVIDGATIDRPAYYLISLWWRIDVDLVGYGHMGNVTAGLSPHIPGATDDSYATLVWPVDCGSLR